MKIRLKSTHFKIAEQHKVLLFIVATWVLTVSNLVTIIPGRATAETVSPVSITAPTPLEVTNSNTFEGTAFSNAKIALSLDGHTVAETVYSDSQGKWTLQTPLSEGAHSVYAQTTVDQVYTSDTVSFTFDSIRPVILNNLVPANDMTKVDVNTTVYFELQDNVALDSKLQAVAQPLTVTDNGVPVPGTVSFDTLSTTRTKITFRPTEPLKQTTNYTVNISPLLPDKAGNYAAPKAWSFTTVGNVTALDPHGNYTNNVNVCADCHSTHKAVGPGLSAPKFGQNVQDYCNACHDGTSAPIPKNWQAGNKHNFHPKEMPANSNSCADCHDPHLSWTKENPNMAKGYYSFTHNDPTNPSLPTTSEEKLCETCHSPAIYQDSRITYVQRQYNKWDTSTGRAEDYSLCQKCHDGSKAVNVAVYTTDVTSGHYFKAQDGSPLDGAMPCAECHETHGSDNLKLLRKDLGDVGGTAFSYTAGDWNVATERNFCTSCHNNTTVLYGKTAALNLSVAGHQTNNQQYCNACHGGDPVKAAHAPVRKP